MKLVQDLLHVQRPRQECDLPVKAGLVQALGVFIDTIVICSCTAMIMLLVPQDQIEGLGRNGTASDSDEISSWRSRGDFYRSDAVPVQFFYISWNSVLCKK